MEGEQGSFFLVVLKVFIYEMKRIECVSVSQQTLALLHPHTHPAHTRTYNRLAAATNKNRTATAKPRERDKVLVQS